MSKRKNSWIAQVWQGPSTCGSYQHLTISLYYASRMDAGKELAERVDSNSEGYYRERLVHIRNANAASAVVDNRKNLSSYWDAGSYNPHLTIRWQANLRERHYGKSGWYSPRPEIDRLGDTKSAQLLVKLSKLGTSIDGATPEQVLTAARALIVKHVSDVLHAYVEDKADLASPKAKELQELQT